MRENASSKGYNNKRSQGNRMPDSKNHKKEKQQSRNSSEYGSTDVARHNVGIVTDDEHGNIKYIKKPKKRKFQYDGNNDNNLQPGRREIRADQRLDKILVSHTIEDYLDYESTKTVRCTAKAGGLSSPACNSHHLKEGCW